MRNLLALPVVDIILVVATILLYWFVRLDTYDKIEIMKYVAGIALIAFGVHACVTSDWFQADQRANEAQRQAEATPHVIREVDGCKVYAFHATGHTHYFTRCPSTTTTDTTIVEHHGKTSSRRVDSIQTENIK